MVGMTDLWGNLDLVVLIIDFIMLFKLFYPSIVGSTLVGIAMAALVTFLLIVQDSSNFMLWLVFFGLFFYSFFWNFRPWEWARD